MDDVRQFDGQGDDASRPSASQVQQAIESLEHTGVLRFITAGSVDDGKSTLIGRILVDARGVLVDQIDALRRNRGKDESIDLSRLTDGLEDERAQGITIDVAYRYFTSPRRKFIIGDTPGHEQYTRNMVTAASTADCAVILIDATRVIDGQLLPQTRRHTALAQMLGVRSIVVAVNKMDLVGWSEQAYATILASYQALADQLGVKDWQAVPVSALQGDYVVHGSDAAPWYQGPALLTLLEQAPVRASGAGPLRLPVQWVIRADGDQIDDFRGYAGRIESGQLAVGDTLTILPSGEQAVVAELRSPKGSVQSAEAGASVTVRLDRDVDVARGDLLVKGSAESAPVLTTKLQADLCWLDREAGQPGRRYLLRHGTRFVQARLDNISSRLNIHTMADEEAPAALAANDIARVSLTLQKPLAVDQYDDLPSTGAFVLIDAASHTTAAAGLIRG